nr:FUSC family protein [uncultured Lichenicoccus sp.]
MAAALDRLAGAISLAGLPAGWFMFCLRTWLAIVLALAIAFWLRLSSADSAAVCVAILAHPLRGQALSKAGYRMGATVLGAAVAVLLCALFPQNRFLLLGGIGLWIAACTAAGTVTRDFRAYGAMLSGYTAAIVGVGVIDQPNTAFLTATDRIAVIAVGVAASTLVNDALSAPEAWRRLARGLRDQAAAVQAVFEDALAGRPIPDDARCAALADAILQLGSQAGYARTELQDGPRRAAGARSAIVALLELVSDSRAIAAAHQAGELPPDYADRVGAARDDDHALAALAEQAHLPAQAFLVERTRMAVAQRALAEDGLRALEIGAAPVRQVALATHRDVYAALLNAARVLIAYSFASGFCILSGLPDSTLLLINVSAMCALSSINPNPTSFAWGVVIGAPLAVGVAAVVTYFALTQGSNMVILALALLPPVFFGCVLSLLPTTGTVGFIMLVWMFIAISPSNPQSFDLLTFTENGLLLILSSFIVFLSMVFLLPASPQRRIFRIAAAIARDLETRPEGDPATLVTRHYDRLTQARRWMQHRPITPVRQAVFSRLTAMAHLGGAISRAHRHLATIAHDRRLDDPAQAAHRSLAAHDAAGMRSAAADLLAAGPAAPASRDNAVGAASGLYGAAALIEANARMLRLTRIIP